MPGRQKSDAKREAILAAAEKEFARRDFHRAARNGEPNAIAHLLITADVEARAGTKDRVISFGGGCGQE